MSVFGCRSPSLVPPYSPFLGVLFTAGDGQKVGQLLARLILKSYFQKFYYRTIHYHWRWAIFGLEKFSLSSPCLRLFATIPLFLSAYRIDDEGIEFRRHFCSVFKHPFEMGLCHWSFDHLEITILRVLKTDSLDDFSPLWNNVFFRKLLTLKDI